MTRRTLLTGASLLGVLAGLRSFLGAAPAEAGPFPVALSEAEWRAKLSPGAFKVLRKHGTERPYSSPLDAEKRAGRYLCAGCDQPLFASATKFESGTGWPSFYEALPDAVGATTDSTLGMTRTEIHCSRCGGHLGHVFDDGPRPTGKRYCMNGVALRFAPA
ncbi:MAG TPA: peptide-methionine (R)-S-oxide reductase MsrB [Methylobacterium sp.]